MPGLLPGVARTAVIAGTATAVSNRVSRRQYGRWARQEEEASDQQAQTTPQAQPMSQQQSTPAPTPDDTTRRLNQLKQLAQLRADGVLTEEELEAEKSRILNQ